MISKFKYIILITLLIIIGCVGHNQSIADDMSNLQHQEESVKHFIDKSDMISSDISTEKCYYWIELGTIQDIKNSYDYFLKEEYKLKIENE